MDGLLELDSLQLKWLQVRLQIQINCMGSTTGLETLWCIALQVVVWPAIRGHAAVREEHWTVCKVGRIGTTTISQVLWIAATTSSAMKLGWLDPIPKIALEIALMP